MKDLKTSNAFKEVITAKLTEMASNDPLFAVNFQKENKSIDECLNYILTTVKKSGIQGFTDQEVFSMAAHYYDEENLNIEKGINCQVVVNHTVQLTEDEIKAAKQQLIDEEIRKMRQSSSRKEAPKPKEIDNQISLAL